MELERGRDDELETEEDDDRIHVYEGGSAHKLLEKFLKEGLSFLETEKLVKWLETELDAVRMTQAELAELYVLRSSEGRFTDPEKERRFKELQDKAKRQNIKLDSRV
jgi:hypothetical protein